MGHVRKRHGRWCARYRGPDGRERSRTFDRKVDAENWLVEQQSARQRGAWVDPALGRLTFGKWVKQWESTLVDLRPTTRVLYLGVARNYLTPRFELAPLALISTSAVKTMLAEELSAGKLSTSAIRRHVLVLSVIMQAAVADGRIARNPCAGVKLPAENARKMRFLDAPEVVELADAITAHYRPLVLTAAYVGLRWGELAGLKLARVDLLRRTIRVEEQLLEVNGKLMFGPPKTKAGERTCSMPAALVDVLAEHFATPAVQSSGLAFPSPKGELMRRPTFQRAWTRALERLRWTIERDEDTQAVVYAHPNAGLVFHELRHTAAALAIAQGAHPLAIKERLGHSSITVTIDRYGGLFPRLDEAIADALDGVLRESLAGSPRAEASDVARLRRSVG